jgi:hypothetical protein
MGIVTKPIKAYPLDGMEYQECHPKKEKVNTG